MKTLEVDEFKYVREAFPIAHEFELIKRKGVYPYDYMDSFARFGESRLPSQNAFFSKLSDGPCSDTECGLPYNVSQWQTTTTYTCSAMCYSRQTSLRSFATCLAHYSLALYTTTPLPVSLGMQLSMTNASLELITDIRMYHFIENSIRVGISMITTRYARANALTLPAYDATRPNVNLIYLDANNLYRWAISQLLPTHEFRFLQPDEIEILAAVELSGDAEDGYIFQVDFSYPQHLYDAHDDYPLAPEPLEIGRDMY